jgi:alcohol dehydrogenase
MPRPELQESSADQVTHGCMRARVFDSSGQFLIGERPIRKAGPGEAVVKVRLTTIGGTDIHLLRGEYTVKPGLTVNHEAVGIIRQLGADVTGYTIGQRVLVSAITPRDQSEPCLAGHTSQCGGPLGGWRPGNAVDGVQAEYFRVPFAHRAEF